MLCYVMKAILGWMTSNCLRLNSGKTEVIIFGNNMNLWTPDWWPTKLGTLPLLVEKVKNLGVMVDKKLSFEDQVSRVISSCFFLLRILRKIHFFLSRDSLRTVVTALILSRLDYCNGLYLNIQKRLMNRLQVVQNAAARLLTGIPRFVSVKRELRQLHWLPVKHLALFKALCTVFKALNGKGPDFLKYKFQWYVPRRMLRSGAAKQVTVPLVKKASWGGRSFITSAAKAWNNLPFKLRNATELLSFRREPKTWLFKLQQSHHSGTHLTLLSARTP